MTPEEFKQARKSLGLDQEQMARLLGYNARSRISEIETGKQRPSDAATLLMRAYIEGYRPAEWPA